MPSAEPPQGGLGNGAESSARGKSHRQVSPGRKNNQGCDAQASFLRPALRDCLEFRACLECNCFESQGRKAANIGLPQGLEPARAELASKPYPLLPNRSTAESLNSIAGPATRGKETKPAEITTNAPMSRAPMPLRPIPICRIQSEGLGWARRPFVSIWGRPKVDRILSWLDSPQFLVFCSGLRGFARDRLPARHRSVARPRGLSRFFLRRHRSETGAVFCSPADPSKLRPNPLKLKLERKRLPRATVTTSRRSPRCERLGSFRLEFQFEFELLIQCPNH